MNPDFWTLFEDWIANFPLLYTERSGVDSDLIMVIYKLDTPTRGRWVSSVALFGTKISIWNGGPRGSTWLDLGDSQLFEKIQKFIENSQPSVGIYSLQGDYMGGECGL